MDASFTAPFIIVHDRASALCVPPFGPLENGPYDDMSHINDSITRFWNGLEDYVLQGGRHPCLPKDMPNSASLEYLMSLPS